MAASSMQDIKRRIKSVTSTEHITNAMKLVSAGKLRKAKATFEKTNENFHYITNTIAEIFHNSDDVPQHYLEGNREIRTTCYVIVTSCRGLCGGFNSNIIKEAEREIQADWEKNILRREVMRFTKNILHLLKIFPSWNPVKSVSLL